MIKNDYTFEDFIDIVRKLRSKDGCPWDKEQSHESLKKPLIEETYEVIEAIDNKDADNLCEELGDVLLQVIMHSVIGEEESLFTIEDVIKGISSKMIRRHPHVFGDKKLEDSGDVLRIWDEIKEEETMDQSITQKMLKVPKSLPANLRAEKVQQKARKIAFDFKDENEVLDKVYEELEELKSAYEKGNESLIEEEFGDLMFSIINLSRYFKINAENSLTNATNKFINRLIEVEILAKREKKLMHEMSIRELNALWEEVKQSH